MHVAKLACNGCMIGVFGLVVIGLEQLDFDIEILARSQRQMGTASMSFSARRKIVSPSNT
jgi:hypothetical protein